MNNQNFNMEISLLKVKFEIFKEQITISNIKWKCLVFNAGLYFYLNIKIGYGILREQRRCMQSNKKNVDHE
jgi:hypothetical protein